MIDPAAIRPDDWNLPLFLHLLGAFVLIGALVMAAVYLFTGRRDNSIGRVRLGYRSLLIVGLPAFLVNRVAAQWIASEEGLDDSDAAWITLGYVSTDFGLLLLLGATLAAGLAVRQAGRSGGALTGGRVALASWLVTALVVVYGVMTWIMATKPV